MKITCKNMSSASQRDHRGIIYVSFTIETIYFIILTSSKNGLLKVYAPLWSSETSVTHNDILRMLYLSDCELI